MGAKLLTERVAAPFAGTRVDPRAGTISNVLLCGTESANGRDYPIAVFRRDYAKYEGKVVNCDHGRETTVERRFGWFSGVRPGDDGRPRGTLNCLKSHPMFARVMEAAERNPALFGFSHVAMCRTRAGTSGREVVEGIDEVVSIDLVADPATTKGFFEGKRVALTVRQLAEALVKHPKVKSKAAVALKRLGEMDGMDSAAASLDSAPAPEADPGEALDQAFVDAAVAEMKECMASKGDPVKLKKCLGKLKKMLQAHAEIVADDGDDDDTDTGDEGTTGGEDEDADEEGKKRGKDGAVMEALAVCEAIQFRPDAGDLRDIADAKKENRPALAAKLKRAAESGTNYRPESAGRGRFAEGVTGSAASNKTEGAPPVDAKGFAKFVAE